jgi:hypothetical protein
VRALVLVGSVARGDARPDSDVDLVFLTTDPQRYIQRSDWVLELGPAEIQAPEHYGRVVSIRAFYSNGLEVEFAIAAADWASAPIDKGTQAVVRRGMRVLRDRDGHATALAAACAARPSPATPA